MIIISQDGYEQINFDNVNRIFINDISLSNISIAVEFTKMKSMVKKYFKIYF